MDQLETECTDPRQEFHHNYLTDADRRRAETRRQLKFPGMYDIDPTHEINYGPSTSGLASKSSATKAKDQNKVKKASKDSSDPKSSKSTKSTKSSKSKTPQTPQDKNSNNSNNTEVADGYYYDDDYLDRKTSTMKKSRSDQMITRKSKDADDINESESATSSTVTSSRAPVAPLVAVPSPNTFRQTKKNLKRGRKRWTYQQLMDSSFRSDNAQGKLHIFLIMFSTRF